MGRNRYQRLRLLKQCFAIFVMLPVAIGSMALVLVILPVGIVAGAILVPPLLWIADWMDKVQMRAAVALLGDGICPYCDNASHLSREGGTFWCRACGKRFAKDGKRLASRRAIHSPE